MLVLDKRPMFHVYKLQDCRTMKIMRSWIYANRLKIYCDSRDKFYTRSTLGDTPTAESLKQAAASADMPINNAADSTAAPTTERRNRHTQNVERRDSDAKMNGSVQSTQNAMASNQDSLAVKL